MTSSRVVTTLGVWRVRAKVPEKPRPFKVHGPLEGFRARMGQPFEQEDRLDHLQRIRARLEALLSGTEGEPGEIGRLVAGYEAIKDGAVPAPRVEAEPELSAPLVEIAPIPVEPEPAPARPAAEAPSPGKFTEAWTQASLFAEQGE